MAEFDSRMKANPKNPASSDNSSVLDQKSQPGNVNSQWSASISQAPSSAVPHQPGQLGRTHRMPPIQSSTLNQVQSTGPPKGQPLTGTQRQGVPLDGSGQMPETQQSRQQQSHAGERVSSPDRPNAHQLTTSQAGGKTPPSLSGRPAAPFQVFPNMGEAASVPGGGGPPRVPQPVSPYAGGATTPVPGGGGPPRVPQPVSPYAGGATTPVPGGGGQPRAPQPVSPYAGGATTPAPGSAGPSQTLRPLASIPGTAFTPTAPPELTEEEKKLQEKKDRSERYAVLTFFERVSYSASLVWAYKSNFIWGGASLLGFAFLARRLLSIFLSSAMDESALALPVFILLNLVGFVLAIGYANLISHVADHGDPDSTMEVIASPLTRLPKILPPLIIWVVIESTILWFCFFLMGSSLMGLLLTPNETSGIGALVGLIILACLAPLCFCYIFYFVETEDFTFVDGLIEPIMLFAANPMGWLSIVPIMIGATITAYIILSLLYFVAFFFFIFIWFLLTLASIFMVLSYITAYAGYVFKQTRAQQELDE